VQDSTNPLPNGNQTLAQIQSLLMGKYPNLAPLTHP